MTKGYVYCISNPSFKENLFKIGFTTKNLQSRIDSLYKTGVPTKFQINLAKMVKNCRRTESEIHLKLKRMRVNPSREFFKCALPKIQGIFEGIQGTWWDDGIITKKEETRSSETKSFHLRSETKNKETPLKVVVKSVKKRMKLGRKAKNVKMNYKL
jgi:hypothetical protein